MMEIVHPFNVTDLESSGERVLFSDPLKPTKSFSLLEGERWVLRVTVWYLLTL